MIFKCSAKIGNKRALSDDADFDDSNTINGDNSTTGATMTTAQANQALAAAKSKILKSLSSQHLVSHLLPVVMSLKHCLEQFKSPLQGALMEYLIYLVKFNKSEVDQVGTFVSFDSSDLFAASRFCKVIQP